MTFQIPAGYEQFVSSPSELMELLGASNVLGNSDFIDYRIYFDTSFENLSQMLFFVEEAKQQCISLLKKHLDDYIWHNDPFHLKIALDSEEKQIYLAGNVKYGENIDDEWFIVHLLMKLSKHRQDISVSVSDSDGQFLLVEAADFIPDWIGPENAKNRVWIRQGLIHIIPIEEPGRDRNGGINLKNAIACLVNSNPPEALNGMPNTHTQQQYEVKAVSISPFFLS